MGKEDLGGSLSALVDCRTLPEAFAIAGTIPEKERIERMIGILDEAGIKHTLELRDRPGLGLLHRDGL